MLGIADGDPCGGEDVEVVVVLLDVFGFEVERIFGDEDGGIGFALDFDEAANVGEGAAAGADVVVGFVGFEVLIFVVENNVAARDGFVGLVVVLDVVGAEALIAVVNVNGAVGGGDVALARLRAAEESSATPPLGGLRICWAYVKGVPKSAQQCERGERKEKRRRKRLRARRGENPGTGIAIHAEHSISKATVMASVKSIVKGSWKPSTVRGMSRASGKFELVCVACGQLPREDVAEYNFAPLG